jgi:hypothetical protein
MLLLFFWSLCAMSKKSDKILTRKLKSPESQKDSSGNRTANVRCQAYTIESLYSQQFIVPEVPSVKYTFRTPLPSFDGTIGNSIVCQDTAIDISYIDHNNAIHFGNSARINESWHFFSPFRKRSSANGKLE